MYGFSYLLWYTQQKIGVRKKSGTVELNGANRFSSSLVKLASQARSKQCMIGPANYILVHTV